MVYVQHSVFPEKETRKLLCDFDLQTYHLISARRPDQVKINKKENKIMEFAVPADERAKLKEIYKKDKYLDLTREWKNPMEHEIDVYTNGYCCSWYSQWKIIKGIGGLGNRGRVKTMKTTTLSKSAWIQRRVLGTWGDFLLLKLQ